MNTDNEYINKFSYLFEDGDIQNISGIEEYIVTSEEELDCLIMMLGMECPIEDIVKGRFSYKINNKYLIILNSFQKGIKHYYRDFILKIRSDIQKNSIPFKYLVEVNNFINFILVFSPEFYTLYNIKKEIMISLQSRNMDNLISIDTNTFSNHCLSEFLFINLINEKNRKCSISWDYRFFLIKNFSKYMLLSEEKILNNDRVNKLTKILDNYLLLFNTEITNPLLVYDLSSIENINEKDKRNYHMWKYIIILYNHYDNYNDRVLIFIFCLYNFVIDPLDHSAYSNSVYIYAKYLKALVSDELKTKLKKYLIDLLTLYKDKMNTIYYLNLIDLI